RRRDRCSAGRRTTGRIRRHHRPGPRHRRGGGGCWYHRLRDPDLAGQPLPAPLSRAGRFMNPLATIGRIFLAFLATTGRITIFTARSLSHCVTPPFFPRLIIRQMIEIGYYSLPVVGLTAVFTGMVLALQSYTGFSRFSAESAIPNVVVLSITRELGPVLAGLMV